MNLLVVDDEFYSVEGICQKIQAATLPFDSVYRAYSLAQAQECFEQTRIDVLITDIRMPKGSGLELVTWVRERGYRTVCVFLTAFAAFDYAQEALRLGGFEYLLKPVDEQELLSCVRRAISRARMLETLGERAEARLEGQPTGVVKEICAYIREHLSEDLTRDELAQRAFLSPDHLSHIFREQTGRSLTDYIMEQRVKRAKELLLASDMSVRDVALASGFQNISYFAKQFKRRTGKTPQAFRKAP